MSNAPTNHAPRAFLRSGGWVLLAAIGLVTAVFAVHVVRMLGARTHAIGDGRHVASYGFDLTRATVSPADIVASGMPKDGLRALVDPGVWTTTQADAATASRSKFLVPSDRVIGVVLGNETRAYPLRLLVWHEIVNDALGGHTIAVTYNPLCDSAVVFDRRVGDAPLTFGVSGLLYNSNLLLYDRRPGGRGESLWSQLLFGAIAGPASGARLEVLPSVLVAWRDWRAAHPDTTVLAPDPRMAEHYKGDPYEAYFGSDLLRYAVRPLPPPERGALKTPLVAVLVGGAWHAFPFPVVAAHAGGGVNWRTKVGELALEFTIRRERPPTVEVAAADGRSLPTVYAFLFAWHAIHGADTIWHD